MDPKTLAYYEIAGEQLALRYEAVPSPVPAHPELAGRIVEGALPHLGNPHGGNFDGILCSAVLMHLAEADLFDAAFTLRGLLKKGGRLLLSLPRKRTDVQADGRDAQGRLFSPYTTEYVQLLFERLGFQLIGRWETEDALCRPGTGWFTLLLELGTGDRLRAVDQIEGIPMPIEPQRSPMSATACRGARRLRQGDGTEPR